MDNPYIGAQPIRRALILQKKYQISVSRKRLKKDTWNWDSAVVAVQMSSDGEPH